MTEQDYDKLLDTSLDELPRKIKPPRDLWVGIDHAIELRQNDKGLHTNKIFQAAAIAAFAVIGSWFFSVGLDSNNISSNQVGSNKVSLTMLANDIDKGFKIQKANILATYEGQPALTPTWHNQLRELEVARNGIWEALKQNPNNVYMIQMLVEVQQQQLDLIENVHTRLNHDI